MFDMCLYKLDGISSTAFIPFFTSTSKVNSLPLQKMLSQKGEMNKKSTTLPETNIAPTNGWLEYYFPIGEAYFQGLR